MSNIHTSEHDALVQENLNMGRAMKSSSPTPSLAAEPVETCQGDLARNANTSPDRWLDLCER